MYGERFYGDEVLFGLFENVFFAGAALKGSGAALVTPVLVSVADALAQGSATMLGGTVLTSYQFAALLGDTSMHAIAVLASIITAGEINLAGDSYVASVAAVLRSVVSGETGGDAVLSPVVALLTFNPLAPIAGDAVAVAVPVLWHQPTASLLGGSILDATGVLRSLTGGVLHGEALVNAVAIDRGVTLATLVGSGNTVAQGVLRLITLGDDVLRGSANIGLAPTVLREAVSGILTGEAIVSLLPVLQEFRTASLVGEGIIAPPVAVLRSLSTLATGGSASTSAESVLRLLTMGALEGNALVGEALPLSYLFATGLLGGATNINPLAWLLWNEDMTVILDSGGQYRTYIDPIDGSLVYSFRHTLGLKGVAFVTADNEGRFAGGGTLYVLLDPSHTGVDADGFAVVGTVT